MPELVVEEVRDQGLLALMREASAGCYCRFWHFSGDDNAWQARCNRDASVNRSELEEALRTGHAEARGLVALLDGEVVGWLKLAPASSMEKIRTRRLYRTLPCFATPRAGVYVIGCVLVRPDARRQGVARALIAASVDAVRAWGGRALEALPRVASSATRDDELWTGPLQPFLEAGFVQVDGPDAYPVLRFELVEDDACSASPHA
ncbi:MAG TPA: GNAT family N-acetyltransferase [Polyangiaceae bacterium]|nr:GNAT family N-acetyltransferase [Polyangiaceae bacterium]